MSKKANKKEIRKIQTRMAIEKKRVKKLKYGYSSFNEDYYATTDHLSYDDLTNLLNLPQAYTGKLD